VGKQEEKVRQKVRVGKIEKAILATLLAVGVLAVVSIAPNVFQVFGRFGLKRNKNSKYTVRTAIDRLKQKGLIQFVSKSGTKVARLTLLGEQVLREADAKNYELKKPRRWDKKWRIIIFDIRERRRRTRDRLRDTLEQIGFVRLQNSVWVYPYDCEDLIQLLKADFKIGKDVLYIIADSIENDGQIRRCFGL